MRLHFAAEIVLELVYQLFGRPIKLGANISEEKARIDFLWEGRISDVFPTLLERAEKIIQADLPIKSEFSDREKEQRYWEIEGFAKVFCGGTHPRRSGEVGQIILKRNNIGKGKERIEIMLAQSAPGRDELKEWTKL
jgi:alanyl-tRNA synthetase